MGASEDQRVSLDPARFETLTQALLEQPYLTPREPRRLAFDGEHLQPTGRRWPDLEEGPWLLLFFWQIHDGRPECVGMAITSSDPAVLEPLAPGQLPDQPQPLTTSTLRSLRLSEILAEERMKLERVEVPPDLEDSSPDRGRDGGILFHSQASGKTTSYVASTLKAIQSGVDAQARLAKMRPATVRRLKLAARLYLEAWPLTDSPTQAVAAGMNISQSAAANLISRARSVGLLPPTSSGVAQG